MSSISAGRSPASAARTREVRGESWFAALGVKGRRAFRAAFAGYMLDAFGYVLAIIALTLLPETQGREIRAVE